MLGHSTTILLFNENAANVGIIILILRHSLKLREIYMTSQFESSSEQIQTHIVSTSVPFLKLTINRLCFLFL